ncbi:tRNA (adenine-N1)-methyltransferase [Geovibrio thiophilus]|uniref:tRNA (adenine(58)-N(1))-methyltransferase TrmI n=1 Tax=Geovibrio thiophilus TaxID=139438 RepID=A0A410K0H9_9BACT|nr:tRNA (adenine-N1)-methyltransferase [Geovibrio thiophilus]QAR33841.1 tRNA (adenine-N1)-methyltransferase [Geovibrio thiophilus]
MNKIEYGTNVILIDEERGKRHMTKLREGLRFTTQYGFIEHDEIVKILDGGIITASKGVRYRVLKPTYIDYIMNIKRRAQIIYPKDTAAMLMEGDVYPGLNVLEAGVGQGALSIAILRALGGKGTLTSYELREDFAGDAARFIAEFYGEAPNHDIQVRNIYESIDGEYDRVLLDLPEPWQVVPHLEKGLRQGGLLVCYLPTILQVKSCVDALREAGYYDEISSFELIKRPWKVDGRSVRPEMWTFNHSAFLITCRKVEKMLPKVKPEKAETPEELEETYEMPEEE